MADSPKTTPGDLRARLDHFRFVPTNERLIKRQTQFPDGESPVKRCLPPIIAGSKENGVEPWLLILGSAPGQESLNRQEYYAHPSQHFWKVMAELFGMPSANEFAQRSYGERVTWLQDRGIALWDICSAFARTGSSDADLRCTKPNDILGILKRYSSIEVIALNGQKAAQLFRRHVGSASVPGLRTLTLPSTSPAHAMKDAVHSKARKWSVLLNSRPPEHMHPAKVLDSRH
jgi:double-stranded uracil-DNA glycosylase